MKTAIQKQCPRCGTRFACNTDDIAKCGCNAVALTPDARAFLANTQYDCLCNHCLEHVNVLVHSANRSQFPTRREQFVEGLHYYVEGGNWVFTEYYHVLRGSCCGSGCRHCAYGFRGKKL